MDSDSELEPKLISLITRLVSPHETMASDWSSDVVSLIVQIISLVSSMDLDSQPKPESKLMSLTTQVVSLFNSMDLDSYPKPMLELKSLLSQKISLVNSEDSDKMIMHFLFQTLSLEPEPELMSLIHQVCSIVISMNSEWEKLISLCPQKVSVKQGKLHVDEEVPRSGSNKWNCFPAGWEKIRIVGEDATYFFCRNCLGKNHKEYSKTPLAMFKHTLHPKHALQLVWLQSYSTLRKCYCCDEDLKELLYYCSACDYAMNMACVEKPLVLSIDHPKWHEHTLALFPRYAPLTCQVCALGDPTSCPFYICPPCDFVVHQRCLSSPRVIRISRHPHRISFTSSFDQRDLSCGVCRRYINNDYGGFICIKKGCLYAAHLKCATQTNVWDGIELEGVPEDIEEEELEPYVKIGEGIIQHFLHEHHHLRFDENVNRDYDENKQCQACITPIYFGNFYTCMQCDFIIHEACANFPRKIHHPIHPHQLNLGGGYDEVESHGCSACSWLCTVGFSYKCSKERCHFKVHVQCATISEPLVHESHMHPLFLTSKPREWRTCCVCKDSGHCLTNETFNCIECDFALCFTCATLPQKVRYRHDKHMLSLSYGKEASSMMFWCEICENKINPKERFYMCDEYCCVTLHIECLLGVEIYMKQGSSWFCRDKKVVVMPNNHHMSRPFCLYCKKRCPQKTFLKCCGFLFCSLNCFCVGDQIGLTK